MTDVQPGATVEPWSSESGSLAPSDLESLQARIETLSPEEATAFCGNLQQRRKDQALVQGLVLYTMRTKLGDGEWGRWNREFTHQTGLSESTIKKRIRDAVGFFGLELTPRMVNARAAADAEAMRAFEDLADDGPPSFGEEDDDDGDWQDEWSEDPDGPTDPGLEGLLKHKETVGEAWAERDSATPSPKYENPPDSPPGGRRPIVAPDDTWMAFTARQIEEEYPALAGEAARRQSRARWEKLSHENPLDLLEDLEQIYEAQDQEVPEEIAAALIAQEDVKPVKPDEVIEPKKARKAAAPKTVEGAAQQLMEKARELHAQVVKGLADGSVTPEDLAAAHAAVSGLCSTAEGLRKKTGPAREKALADERRSKADATRDAVAAVPGAVEW
jgi:hypothetical protein